MLKDDKIKLLQELVMGLDRAELSWLSGYMTGLAAGKVSNELPEEVSTALPTTSKITIAYGTESGNSKKLAAGFVQRAKGLGIQAKLVNLAQYRLNDLPKEEYFFTVISTQGEGEPPESARKFYDHLNTNEERLEHLKYGVLALGDTSYPLFCKAGEDVDGWLGERGGTRLVNLMRCDTDYTKDAEAWFEQVLELLKAGTETSVPVVTPEHKPVAGKQLYEGTVISNTNLNDRGSAKQTHHLELSAPDTAYEPGDSLGIVPENPFQTVQGILSITKIPQTKIFQRRQERLPVEQWLKNRLNIVYLSERVVKNYATITGHDIPVTRIGLLDLLRIYPVLNVSQFEEILEILDPITPRLYSISSSPSLYAGEVHLTIALDKFTANQEIKYGLCSQHLINQQPGSRLTFYIHRNQLFKLPAPEVDMIMIGPGTGIAPFRSFIGEREATGATGKNWLFFGDQHFTSDFLYQTEIQDWNQNGTLTRVNLAFSRDQQQKIYVQHRLLEHGAKVFEWIAGGASVYICGAKEPMAGDVEATLLKIATLYGKEPDAEGWLNSLADQGRYLKDVY